MERGRILFVWLVLLALGFAAFGQAILSFAREATAIGFACYAVSMLLFALVLRSGRVNASAGRLENWLLNIFGRFSVSASLQASFVMASAAAMIVTIGIAQSNRPQIEYWLAFGAWLLGVLLLTIGFVVLPARPYLGALRQTLSRGRVEVLLVAGVTLIACALRLANLASIPYPFGGDEGSVGISGQNILGGTSTNLFVSGWYGEPRMSFLPYAIAMALFGQNIFALRLVVAVIGTLTIPVVYVFVRSMFDRNMALTSAVLLSTMSVDIHFSRIAQSFIEPSFYAALLFWLAYKGVESRRMYWFGAAGLAGGLAVYSYAGTRFVPMVAGLYLAYAFITDRSQWPEWPKYLVFGLSGALVVSPIAYFFWQHPDAAFTRMNQMGVVQNGWLAYEIARTHEPAVQILGRLTLESFLVFVSTPAVYGYYNSPGPLLDGVWSLFFVLGLIFSILGIRQRRNVLLQMMFWSVILVAGGLFVPPPAAERLSMSFAVVAIFVALGLCNVASLLGAALNIKPAVNRLLVGIGVVLMAYTSLQFYFFEYTPKHYYTDANSEVGEELGTWLAPRIVNARVYFYGEPRMFIEFASLTFLAPKMDGVDVHSPAQIQSLVDTHKGAIFVALPNNRAYLEQIAVDYPGGEWYERSRRTVPGETLFVAYTVAQISNGSRAAP